MKQTPIVVLLFALVILASCNKNEARTELPDTFPPSLSGQNSDRPTPPPLRGGAHTDIPDLSGAKVIIPDMVKGKWKSVKLMLENKKTHEITEHPVNLGEIWNVPGSEIQVKVGVFLPDLIIQGTVFTSVSNELKNPAIHVVITEKGVELFEGWLFSLFPTMHPFEHDNFAITLKDVLAS
ncbi:MAG: hypothetical protein ABGX83_02715 [Nitrospira sp.]|nr:DUF2155 domain-containing protein [Candidatus Manganitrophaceae bacterium]HIL34877.1 DUF2155 domain-containing protein [Candidatus Manganitrophaceae bacterium]